MIITFITMIITIIITIIIITGSFVHRPVRLLL